ncbi:hypothetical protein QBC35DRAFT_504661 [Podospora australis]|uniref:dolichol kinase n=1 Tax=Podospora australis TaxID=1536484 RepID=A0AAN7AFS4_9PEZI|nr:hypothetical protein QBC35DRAFT_504661 [Podospora australis]
MSEHLQPPNNNTAAVVETTIDDADGLRILSRSPHPYHHQNSDLLEPSDRLIPRGEPFPPLQDSTPPSDSGTEADDEHFLKGLPAPKARLHKGLRGKNEPLSGTSTPMLSPAVMEEEGRKISSGSGQGDKRGAVDRVRRRKEIIRRGTEILLLGCQGGMIALNRDVHPFLSTYQNKLIALLGVLLILVALYPLRLIIWAHRRGNPSKAIPIRLPASFDPAPLLYPLLIPIFISFLVAQNVKSAVLPNLVLGISALPRALFPGSRYWETLSCSHWLFSCIPFALDRFIPWIQPTDTDAISPELLVLLYPLHQTLCLILRHLTTTSLLLAELQLLSVALINVLLLANSPQAVILQAILWLGGLGVIVSCGPVIRWGITLARVPKWRFKRSPPSTLKGVSAFKLLRQLLTSSSRRDPRVEYADAISGSEGGQSTDGNPKVVSQKSVPVDSISDNELDPAEPKLGPRLSFAEEPQIFQTPPRRHTLPSMGKLITRSKTSTPSGRKKRSTSSSVRAFFSLTQSQATLRRWLYAGWVYICTILVIFLGIRTYVQHYALHGNEPIGWALGYLFGDLSQFRFQVVNANLERWICLPPRLDPEDMRCSLGWIQHLRVSSFGEANTRLILSAYWLVIIAFGLAVVFTLSPIYEVDTRRKVFHFMMVAMFLPTIYVDPTWVALALSVMLAVFLLLDLLRASQLPPLSKPIATFLTPYVDGRDLRGPVVISHIFLLIGCAIPLWLSLAALPREGTGFLQGWEVPTRDVSMVSGVVCVGLGDAAASLIGRRWGHRKWLWGGGKSIEGSLAFAVAVFAGLMGAALWLRVGGWPVSSSSSPSQSLSGYESLMSVLDFGELWGWAGTEMKKTAVCASMASLTEAVLTGGNDNVVVPVVLWGCVKALGV